LREEFGISIAVVNCENAAGGLGITRSTAQELLDAGADVLTTGNHIWKHAADAKAFIPTCTNVLVPANLSQNDNPGPRLFRSGGVAVFQLQGRLFMNPLVRDPFEVADAMLREIQEKVILVDFHAEATSEKGALAHFLDRRVSGVFGTHTHVQTSDERVLPGGTGFISDLGMTGSWDGIIGVEVKEVERTFLTGFGGKTKPARGRGVLEGAVFEIGDDTGLCSSVTRIRRFA